MESYTYDAVGNLATFTTRAGATQTYSYDALNRQTGFAWSDGTPAVTRTYDNASHLLSSANAASTSSYTYDDAGEELSETQNSGTARTVAYTYDADGNKETVTYPSGTVLTYSRTNRNQISDIATASATVASYDYDLDGNVATKELADSTTAIYLYDDADRLVTLNHTLGSTSFVRFDYGYNVLNDRTYEQRNLGVGDVYGYDADRQITGVKYGATSPAGTPSAPTRTVGYSYDNAGNRLSVSDTAAGTTSYSVNNLNQYTSVGGTSYGYDGNGNLTSGPLAASYDSQNRALGVTNGSHTMLAVYDSRNRVVSRTVDGTTYSYVYDGWKLIEEYNSSGTLQASYIHGIVSDEMLSRTTSSSTVYYHQNALGSVANLTNASGSVVENYSYDVFGRPTITNASGTTLTASAYGNRFLFTGREWLAKINLYDYRNRVYSADLGRFLQTDPLRFSAGDANIYRYCGNNSANLLDPSGKVSWPTVIGQKTTAVPFPQPQPARRGKPPHQTCDSGSGLDESFPDGDDGDGGGDLGDEDTSWSEWDAFWDGFTAPNALQDSGSGFAFGLTFEFSSINPFTSGGGGSYGINIEYTTSEGWGLYDFYTPNSMPSYGLTPGVSVTANAAVGTGSWTGPFEGSSASAGFLTAGAFQSIPASPGYTGLQAGVGAGPVPVGVGISVTNYDSLAGAK